MSINHLKLGRAATFMKYLANGVSLTFLPKSSIWNKITFSASHSLTLAVIVVYELMKSFSIKITNIPFSI